MLKLSLLLIFNVVDLALAFLAITNIVSSGLVSMFSCCCISALRCQKCDDVFSPFCYLCLTHLIIKWMRLRLLILMVIFAIYIQALYDTHFKCQSGNTLWIYLSTERVKKLKWDCCFNSLDSSLTVESPKSTAVINSCSVTIYISPNQPFPVWTAWQISICKTMRSLKVVLII